MNPYDIAEDQVNILIQYIIGEIKSGHRNNARALTMELYHWGKILLMR